MKNKLSEWEWLQESRHNAEMEAQDILAEMSADEYDDWKKSPCRKCHAKKYKCRECEV
jgi:hypothetical protein